MWHHFVAAGLGLSKRTADDNPNNLNFPVGLILALALLFAPLFLITSYSLKLVYPVLAIVENAQPPSYEVVASNEHDATLAPGSAADSDDPAGLTAPITPITSSLRRTFRLLYAAGGWRGHFRGLFAAAVLVTAGNALYGVLRVVPFLPSSLRVLVADLALVQLSTAWVHAVIRADASPKRSFFRSLPPFRRTFQASGPAVAAYWFATAVTRESALALAEALKLPKLQFAQPVEEPPRPIDGHIVWKLLLVILLGTVVAFLLVVPATVVLVRVQASLLAPEEDTIVPFDRSFGGAVEPLVVDGRGYATMQDAFRTFSRASWRRLLLLTGKAYLIGLAVQVLFAAVAVPLVLLNTTDASPPSY